MQINGDGGINIETGTLVMNGYLITAALGATAPGAVTVTAAESITLNGDNCRCIFGTIETQANAALPGAGQTSGDITLTSPSVTLSQGGSLLADVIGPGFGGNIMLNVGTLSLSGDLSRITSKWDGGNLNAGRAGDITVQGLGGPNSSATSVDIAGPGSGISSTTQGAAPAGSILVNTQDISLSNETEISSSTSSTGNAGSVTIIAPGTFQINGGMVTTSTSGTGQGGTILVDARIITLTNGAQITSNSTSNTSNAGSVTLELAGLFSSQGSTVSSSAAQGTGGNISITAGNMILNSATTISAESAGSENSGNIALTSATDLLMRNSTVTTSAAQASGGNIKLTAPNLVRIVDSTLTSSVQGQVGSDGGNIAIDPLLVVIQNSNILANANAGAGGNIIIAASGAVLVDPNSLLSATAGPAGVSGSVNINSPIQVLSGALVPLNLVYSQAGLSGDRCAADPQGQFSSFVQTGRDGVPQVPGALSPSPLSFLDTLTTGSLGSPWPNVAAARLGLDSVSIDDSTLFRFHSACHS